jgi:hypothetical protein
MARTERATVESTLHPDGAVSHKVEFANGEKRLVFTKAENPLAQRSRAHGEKAKILAAINSAKDVAGAVTKVDSLDKAWQEGRWSLAPEGTGKPRVGALVQALAALKGASLDDAAAYVGKLSRADQAKLRATPVVAAKILEIEAEERTEGAGDLLSDFLGVEAEGQAGASGDLEEAA